MFKEAVLRGARLLKQLRFMHVYAGLLKLFGLMSVPRVLCLQDIYMKYEILNPFLNRIRY